MLYTNCLTGLMENPVSNLNEPPPSRLLCKIDNVFVEGLKQRLKEDPAGPGVVWRCHAKMWQK